MEMNLANSSHRASWRWTLLAVVLMMLCATGCGTADLRTNTLKETGLTPAAVERGKQVLAEAVQAHGGHDGLGRFTTADVVLRDTWPGWLARTFFMPWPENNQPMRLQYLLGTFTSRVEILEGEGKGTVKGIQAWHTYAQEPGAEIVFEDDEEMAFFLPSYHYFFEFPFRISKAPIVAYAGEDSLHGQRYDLVFVTWNQAEPDETTDQYILWINPDTRLIDYAQYTVRDQANWAAGTNHFSDYREVEGIMIPYKQTITSEPGGTDVLHEMVVEQVRFDTISPEVLLPDAGLTEMGDRKPEPTQ